MLYNYSFYLFGAVLNPLLLIYAVVVALSGWALVLALSNLDWSRVASPHPDGRHRWVAGWMLFVSLGLGATWTAQWVGALLRTAELTRFDVTPEFIRLVAGLDLTLLVSILLPGAVLLWRQRPWGRVLGASMNVSGTIYNVVLAGGTLPQIRAGLPGAVLMLGLWLFLAAGCLTAAFTMLNRPRFMGHHPPAGTDAPQRSRQAR
jgi:hypothetical protein